MTVGGVDVVEFGKDVFREYKDDDVSGLAAELTYRSFLALFPFVLFLAALGAALANVLDVENPAERFVDMLGDNVPADAKSVIEGQIEGMVANPSFGVLSIGLIGALWASMGGAGSVIKALNRAYDIPDTRPFWRQKLLSLGLVLMATIAIFGGVAIIFATQVYGQQIADELGMGSAFRLVISVVAWPLLVAFLVASVAFVYWAAPNVGLPFRWVSPGAVFFAITWAIGSLLFGIYVANFGSYNATYGALGGVVVLLLWFYISSLVLLLGAEINAVLDEQKNGPVLQERRQKAAEQATAKAKQQPRNPDAVGPEAANAATDRRSVPAGTLPAQAQALSSGGGSTPTESAARPATSTSSALLALIGLIVTALAARRFAR